MCKEKARRGLVFLKGFWQKIFSRRLSVGDFFVDPKPVYLGQLAKVDKKKAEGFYGKIFDRRAAKRFGAKNLDEFSFWSWRSCGVVCVQMVLKTLLKELQKTTMDLVRECLNFGGYCYKDKKTGKEDVGWYHRALCKLAGRYGVSSRMICLATPFDVIGELRKNRFVIASVESDTGGHLFLIFGVKADRKRNICGFYFHDPYDFNQRKEADFIDIEEFRILFKNRLFSLWKEKRCLKTF